MSSKKTYQQPTDNQGLRKRKVLHCKSYAFGQQKRCFHRAKGDVLKGKRWPFIMRHAKCEMRD